MHIFQFLWRKSFTLWHTNAFRNQYTTHKHQYTTHKHQYTTHKHQYTTHKHLNYPEHSPINLFCSLLAISYRRLPNWQNIKKNHWRIQGAHPGMRPPQMTQFFHFNIQNFTKCSRLGSPRPPLRGPRPLREILDPPLKTFIVQWIARYYCVLCCSTFIIWCYNNVVEPSIVNVLSELAHSLHLSYVKIISGIYPHCSCNK